MRYLLNSRMAVPGQAKDYRSSSALSGTYLRCSGAIAPFMFVFSKAFSTCYTDSLPQMAEEIRNAEVVVPWSMVSSTLLNGALGWALVIAVLFVASDITSALESPTGLLGFPIMQIFLEATNNKAGASVLVAILIVMSGAGTMALMATSSRLIWAFSRDRGLPGWRTVSKVKYKIVCSASGLKLIKDRLKRKTRSHCLLSS